MTHYDTDKSLLLQLRSTAMVERDELVRFNMRKIADELQSALATFVAAPTSDHLTNINGLWVRGIRQLSFATKIDPEGGGAKMRIAA